MDVGVAKPLKYDLKNQWGSWMIEEATMQDREISWRSQIDSGLKPPQFREKIDSWTVPALLPKQLGMHGVIGILVGFPIQ